MKFLMLIVFEMKELNVYLVLFIPSIYLSRALNFKDHTNKVA